MARAAPFTLAVSNFPYLLFICFLSILSFITIPITNALFFNNSEYTFFKSFRVYPLVTIQDCSPPAASSPE